MTDQRLAPYTVTASNSAKDSENKLHDDAVARRLGFSGGLVPGVDVFAYLCHTPLTHWGAEFLRSGEIQAKLVQPVYDGDLATVEANLRDDIMTLDVTSRGDLCANGQARLLLKTSEISPAGFPASMPPADEARPSFNSTAFRAGDILGMRPHIFTPQSNAQHLGSVRETNPVYLERGIVHPGSILRLLNWTLMQNVRLPPWLHLASTIRFLAMAHVGDALTIRAKVIDTRQSKGRFFVTLEAIALANEKTVVAAMSHNIMVREQTDAKTGNGHGS